MISVELKHNPYLLETDVKFNGQSPKINSQIEKYDKQLLPDWVRCIPKIFYDEMNGYDFDLYFSGTEYDFQRLNNAFLEQNIKSDQVRIIMRDAIEDAEIKRSRIYKLLAWLKKEKNRQFDFEIFYSARQDVFEESFSCVVVRGIDELIEGLPFVIENVNSVEDLADTNLFGVPIVFVVEKDSAIVLKKDLEQILKRKDVAAKQLFFYISSNMDREDTIRSICDLGVDEPKIIDSVDDGNVSEYVINNPMVAYVSNVIKYFETEINILDEGLKEKNAQSTIENAEIREQIINLDEVVSLIERVDDYFTELSSYNGGTAFITLKEELQLSINNWRRRKTKIVGENDIEKKAQEYNQELKTWVNEFFGKAIAYYQAEKNRIDREFNEKYSEQKLDIDFKPEGVVLCVPKKPEIRGIENALLRLKEEHYEDKKDLKSLFKSSSQPKEQTLVVTCDCEKWRKKAFKMIIPDISSYIAECQDNLKSYCDELASKYHDKLLQLYEEKIKEKSNISSQLSEDERMLQADNDWLNEFKNQLFEIMRA